MVLATVLFAAACASGAGLSYLAAAFRAANLATTPAVLCAVAAGASSREYVEQTLTADLLNGVITAEEYRSELESLVAAADVPPGTHANGRLTASSRPERVMVRPARTIGDADRSLPG